jgi:sarcosine oxidase, subunit gamma
MMNEHHPLLGREIAVRKAMPLTVCPAPDTARFSLRIDPTQLAQASTAFGLDLPAQIGDVSVSRDKIAACLGPDEWYLEAPLSGQQAVETAFADLYATVPHSLVDVGHRDVGIEIEGADAALALRSAVPFDVEAMPVRSGCRTIFDKTQIVLVRETEDRFRIAVWRSFADHVWGILRAVSREVELDI